MIGNDGGGGNKCAWISPLLFLEETENLKCTVIFAEARFNFQFPFTDVCMVSLRWVRCRPLEDWDEEEEVGERRKIKAELVWLLDSSRSASSIEQQQQNCWTRQKLCCFCFCSFVLLLLVEFLPCFSFWAIANEAMQRFTLLYFLLFPGIFSRLAYQPLRSARERASASALLFQPECFSLNQSESSFVFLPLFFCLYSVIACISSLGVGEGECALHCTSLFPSLAIHREHWQNQQNPRIRQFSADQSKDYHIVCGWRLA